MRSESHRSSPQPISTDSAVWGARLAEYESRLNRIVSFRLDSRLNGRIDASDVVQDVFLEATAHRADYESNPTLPLFLWLRGIVNNKLLEMHRHHLGTHMRAAGREVALAGRRSGATSASIAYQLTGHGTGPSTAAAREDTNTRLMDALNGMEPIDREVLALRHFEQLTSAETARVLGIQERAAAKRYLRALQRLRDILADMPGGLTELRQ
jgi:RNA polymerase sigma-70 factor, ECF subfamily